MHELCRARGHAISADLAAVGVDARAAPRPLLASYVELNLATLQAAGALGQPQEEVVAAKAAAPAPAFTPAPARPPPATPGATSKSELASIFRLIGAKATSEAGLDALAVFRRARPHVDLAPHLAKTSDHFRAYIARGVARADERWREGQEGGGGERVVAEPAAPAAAQPAGCLPPPSLDELRARVEAVRLTAVGGAPAPARAPAAGPAASLAALRERVASLKRGAKAPRRD